MQLALPGDGPEDAVLVDPLVDGLDLAPLYDLFRDAGVVKVFHAARQDLEIFFTEGGVIPAPLFDTQVAAMVCGFGEQVGYETLVRKIAKAQLDKTRMFYDPAEAVEFVRSAELPKTMEFVATFLFEHGILGTGAPSADFVGIAYPGGATTGDAANVMLRFDTSFMQMAADGAL